MACGACLARGGSFQKTRARIALQFLPGCLSRPRADRSERTLHYASIDAQGRTRGCRCQRTGDVGHQGSNLLRRGEPLDERGWANFLKKLLLELAKGLPVRLGKGFDEVFNAA